MSDDMGNEISNERGDPLPYLGIVFWYNPGLRKGVLCDLNGTTYVFKDVVTPHGDYIRSPVFRDGWQPVTRPGKLKNGSEGAWLVTEPTIIEFSLEYFRFREDGAEGSQILSVAPASDFTQADYEDLITIRDKYEARELAERKARQEAANPREGNYGPRTRHYSTQ
jgi:hypothetical protein